MDLMYAAWLYTDPKMVIGRLCVHTAASLNSFLSSTEQIAPYELVQGSLGVVAGVTGCDPQNLDNPKNETNTKRIAFVDYVSLYASHRKQCCRSHRDAIRHIIERWEHFNRTDQP